jgi:dihydropteroate synthase
MLKSEQILSINIGGKLYDFSRPRVMGIVNATPDSFFADSRHMGADAVVAAERLLAEGADMLDLGACSTRPGSREVSAAEEQERLDAALEGIREKFPDVIISVDTWRAEVARKCVERWNVNIINDISGGDYEPEIWNVAADFKIPYIAMHTRGVPSTMSSLTDYDDVAADVLKSLVDKADALHQIGVCDVILDPGFGFAKTVDQNFELLAHLNAYRATGCPLLVGVSRKRMIWEELKITPSEALPGTTAVNTIALLNGADILRVHDVAAAVQAVCIYEAYKRNMPQKNRIERY